MATSYAVIRVHGHTGHLFPYSIYRILIFDVLELDRAATELYFITISVSQLGKHQAFSREAVTQEVRLMYRIADYGNSRP